MKNNKSLIQLIQRLKEEHAHRSVPPQCPSKLTTAFLNEVSGGRTKGFEAFARWIRD